MGGLELDFAQARPSWGQAVPVEEGICLPFALLHVLIAPEGCEVVPSMHDPHRRSRGLQRIANYGAILKLIRREQAYSEFHIPIIRAPADGSESSHVPASLAADQKPKELACTQPRAVSLYGQCASLLTAFRDNIFLNLANSAG
eukprot:CAMPEP_0184479950 /NCGR_PEP_ID=MMETSP0113_2-20130426/1467_1 /TAXON_ID=91329 /ORGANISM="Norrisiella sphaerica, Strain BC52" /LENGTH=143 /DNA_ID=CAMNT_0026858127 /DNA_START=618 /DNA_END=1049 /DNA_ORIENTATION=+